MSERPAGDELRWIWRDGRWRLALWGGDVWDVYDRIQSISDECVVHGPLVAARLRPPTHKPVYVEPRPPG